jgi:hypothetical protein
MSIWEEQGLTERVVDVLSTVHLNADDHHFGRPYVTAYQIAIALEEQFPAAVAAIGKPIGGRGIGQHNSLAQYLGAELSRQIREQGANHPIEGAFISNEHVSEVRYQRATGEPVVSSLTGTPYDLALFRLR